MINKIFYVFIIIITLACSRPDAPPVTPVQPPTVESTPTPIPTPVVDSPAK